MSLTNKNILHFNENAAIFPKLKGLDRALSLKKYQEMDLPNSKMEKWQKSKIGKVLKTAFEITGQDSTSIPVENNIPLYENLKGEEFINGNYIGSSMIRTADGVIIGNISAAIEEYPELVKQHLNKYLKEDLNGLNALNNASFDQGYFLYVPKNITAKLPVYWLNHFAGMSALFVQMRNLLILEEGASITLLNTDDGDGGGAVFTNSVTEVFVGANARLEWYREQDLRYDDSMVNSVFCHMERDSYLKIINTSIHGNMLRNDVHVKMDGPGCDANVMGLYLPITGEQVDNQVYVEHAKPNCVSNELFKGVLNGNGSSIFNGHIYVAVDAQQTNAYQTNRNVLLSDDANAFAKPFLEIYADDVKCSHGATVGQLDETALFYLRSRGLTKEKARSFLVKAFVGEVLDHCGHEEFRTRLEKKVNKKLEESR